MANPVRGDLELMYGADKDIEIEVLDDEGQPVPITTMAKSMSIDTQLGAGVMSRAGQSHPTAPGVCVFPFFPEDFHLSEPLKLHPSTQYRVAVWLTDGSRSFVAFHGRLTIVSGPGVATPQTIVAVRLAGALSLEA